MLKNNFPHALNQLRVRISDCGYFKMAKIFHGVLTCDLLYLFVTRDWCVCKEEIDRDRKGEIEIDRERYSFNLNFKVFGNPVLLHIYSCYIF